MWFTKSPDPCLCCVSSRSIYIGWDRLQPLFQLFQNLLHCPLHLPIHTQPICGPTNLLNLLVNLLLVLAKIDIHHSRRRKLDGESLFPFPSTTTSPCRPALGSVHWTSLRSSGCCRSSLLHIPHWIPEFCPVTFTPITVFSFVAPCSQVEPEFSGSSPL